VKDKKKLLTVLNSLLADEFAAVNQYIVHAEMCANWGYNRLHSAIRNHAMDEMRHAVWLIDRIIFFGGTPAVSTLNNRKIGKTVSQVISFDISDEHDAVKAYNIAIDLARDDHDQGTVDLLTKILKMEENHLKWTETQHSQIEQIGMENYLCNQTEILVI